MSPTLNGEFLAAKHSREQLIFIRMFFAAGDRIGHVFPICVGTLNRAFRRREVTSNFSCGVVYAFRLGFGIGES